jgi:hypothetical protein
MPSWAIHIAEAILTNARAGMYDAIVADERMADRDLRSYAGTVADLDTPTDDRARPNDSPVSNLDAFPDEGTRCDDRSITDAYSRGDA